MSDTTQEHWDRVYTTRAPTQVGWFQSEPTGSLAMIAATGVGPSAALIDVGGGTSRLVDRLLDQGFPRITVLDISSQALEVAKARLGPRADTVDWLVADVTRWWPADGAFDLWHDRAVFHFLIEPADRDAYVRALTRGLRGGGHAIFAPFALSGPDRCSGLPVQRYAPEGLQAVLGEAFQFLEARPETHRTPSGVSQDFVWCLFRKIAD